MKKIRDLIIICSIISISTLFSSCTIVEKNIVMKDDGLLYSKKIMYPNRNLSVLKYKKKNHNGLVIEKEKQILDTRGTWSTTIFVATLYYDSITGKKKSIEKYWTEKN